MAVADRSGVQHKYVALALSLLMVCIWSMTHRYRELSADAELYAVQALAKLHPALATDIYLQNASQDRYTVFSWFYAKLMGAVGLQQAARGLYIVFSAWFLAATWALARRLSDAATAWLSLLLVMILVGHYGSYGVFRYAEEFLTARSVAEALIVTAIAVYYGGARAWAIAIAAAMMFIHPLMALPGLLLLICLWAGPRISIAGALTGIILTLLFASLAHLAAHSGGLFEMIDGAWLEVVRERSQFLFLQLWRASDWKGNAVPFASLALSLLVLPDQRMRELAWASMLVGATGLGVALIASTIGPVAILLQGQAWRWVWIPSFVSILLLAPTLLCMWRDTRCGPGCALLLIGGWSCAALNFWACYGLALALWLARPYISGRVAQLLRWAALILALVLIAWTIANAWMLIRSASPGVGRDTRLYAGLRNILGLQTATLMLFGLAWWWLGTRRSLLGPAIACVALAAMAASALPSALMQVSASGTPAEILAYGDWRSVMPEGSNVAVLGVHNSAGFVWFTLGRSDYLSIDQSSGVVFSRATATEVKRRSEVLAPLVQPSWKVMTYLARWARGERVDDEKDLPLTAAALIRMCRDNELDFVVARDFAGFDPVRHTQAGAYKDWYLYDCHHVRSAGQPA
jgi:hypothetical protein